MHVAFDSASRGRTARHEPAALAPTLGHVSTFQANYTDRQRDALACAVVDRGIKPARVVVALAEKGELEDGLPPFKVVGGAATVRDFARKLRMRRAGEVKSELAKKPPADALEALRQRMIAAGDEHLAEGARRRKAGRHDPEYDRQVARLLREIAAIPGPNDPRPPKPGAHIPGAPSGVTAGGPTRGGLAGRMLAEMRDGATPHDGPTLEPEQQPAPPTNDRAHTTHELNTERPNPTAHHEQKNDNEDERGDSWLRAQVAALEGRG